MSRIGSDPFANAQMNPIYSSRADSTQSVRAASGQMGDHSIQLATKADPPAHQSGIGDKIKSFFKAIGNAFEAFGSMIKNSFTRAPRNEAPATPPANAAPTPAPATAPPDPEITRLKGTLPFKLFASAITPASLSDSERSACSYAYVKNEASKSATEVNGVGKFLRDNSNVSKISANIASGKPEIAAIKDDIVAIVGDTVVGLSNAAYGRAAISAEDSPVGKAVEAAPPQHPGVLKMQTEAAKTGADYRTDIARNSVAVLDDVMCAIYGTPGDQHSISDAADKLPQALCDQLAILHKAVDDSNAAPGDKATLKLQCARDVLALRSFNPAISMAGAGQDKSVSSSMLQLAKGVQNLVNGVGLGAAKGDTADEVLEAGDGMKERWNATFAAFADAVVARADPGVVADAARDGASLHADFRTAERQIATRQAAIAS